MTTVSRPSLYQEVWQRPIGQLSGHYGVPAAKVREACKALSVPVPPAGYWASKRAGKEAARPPLPDYDGPNTFTLRAAPRESLVDWLSRTTPPPARAIQRVVQRTSPPSATSVVARYVPLSVWAKLVFGDHTPHSNTLLKWVREGRIQPQPKKIGRGYFLVPHAEYISD